MSTDLNAMMAEDEAIETFLAHYGTPRHSGRYPWGSGEEPYQSGGNFLSYVDELKKKGLTDNQIADAMKITSSQFREFKSMYKAEKRAADAANVQRLSAKGMSNIAIGKQMGIPESSVRSLKNPALLEKNNILKSVSDRLRTSLENEGGYIDIGRGTENHLGISDTKLKTAVAVLKQEGYQVFYVKTEQLGTGKETNIKVLAPPGTTYPDVVKNTDKIRLVAGYSEDGGRTFEDIKPPVSVDSKRVAVRYAEQGGADKDGVIELRRGVPDTSLGNSQYAQVRIAVDGTHYLKGMAMYSDNVPAGHDMVFNTNKSDTGNKLDAMKKLKDDPENPFGSTVRQKHYTDAKGNSKQSVLNIVGSISSDGETSHGEEGGWEGWSKTLSSQMLSKQSPALAKQQLQLSYDTKASELADIQSLTNPAVKRKLLQDFADNADSSAVHLKAAGLPRTAAHVILPINSLKDGEIYAPKYNNGEKVVLIRHPHGGTFEIPELTVNNRNKEANSVMKNAKDAVGINSNVAARLSGADFDGDTVLVIPQSERGTSRVRTSAPLKGLTNFDPKTAYPKYEGMKVMTEKAKGKYMGDVSNLITDMSIQGASNEELARAVRHSMVVIDAAKHELNYKQSAIDNGIAGLKTKYQGKYNAGAATLISRAKSEARVPEYKARSAAEGGAIDPRTGEKKFTLTGATFPKYKRDADGNVISVTEVPKTIKSTKMAETRDARTLVSKNGGTDMEAVYAEHANKLKALANTARKDMVATKSTPYSPSAKTAYAREVASLNAKLDLAQRNAPLERQAQLAANTSYQAKVAADPSLDSSQKKKLKGQELDKARARMGAGKKKIEVTPNEWAAIQSGAITNNKLEQILANMDSQTVKTLATPRDKPAMNSAKLAQAKSMLARGYTQAEVAAALGVSTSTIANAIKKG